VLVVKVFAVVGGVLLVLWTLISALKTVVVPRAYVSVLTRVHFVTLRRIFNLIVSPRQSFARRDSLMALYAPLGLVTLPAVWVSLIIGGFTLMVWGTGHQSIGDAFVTSGSSLLTLGFVKPDGVPRIALSFVEAGIGLGVVSLMISYLPTIYGAFSRREALVGMLEVRAGLPPSPAELLTRYSRIGWIDRIDDDLFQPWEQWFIDVEESHTSQGALAFFRSPHPGRSWITAAGCVLDTAAIVCSVLDRPYNARGPLMLRSGFFCLRRIADFFRIPYVENPTWETPISITRREFDLACVEMEAMGLPLKRDRDQAWRDFAGWRANYDEALVGLCALVMAPPAKWSSDRMPSRAPLPPVWFPNRRAKSGRSVS
jgi:hypothetical protein